MRWNCPHCEELVTAGIDFENTKKAYVRCAKCNGMALVHRSAVLADYVKARRLEEEAQLEAELRLTQSANANSRIQAMEAQIRGLNEKITAAANASANAAATSMPMSMPPPPNAAMGIETGLGASAARDAGMDPGMAMNMDMTMEAPRAATPPPFHPSFEAMEEGSVQMPIDDVAAAPPVFAYAKPPAFLLKPTASAIETVEKAFAADEETGAIEAKLGDSYTIAANPISLRPTIALWLAAALAIGSGVYLYREGKKALAPTTTAAPAEADSIRSNANSAVRVAPRATVIVRVARALLRDGPSTDSESVQTLDRAAVANVLLEKDGWMKIESPKIATRDRTAWVRADLVLRMPD